MKKWGKSINVAEAVSYLASSRAGFVSGQIINVDGGVPRLAIASSTGMKDTTKHHPASKIEAGLQRCAEAFRSGLPAGSEASTDGPFAATFKVERQTRVEHPDLAFRKKLPVQMRHPG